MESSVSGFSSLQKEFGKFFRRAGGCDVRAVQLPGPHPQSGPAQSQIQVGCHSLLPLVFSLYTINLILEEYICVWYPKPYAININTLINGNFLIST